MADSDTDSSAKDTQENGDDIQHKCVVCEKVFPSKPALLSHSLSHKINMNSPNPDKEYTCEICGRNYTSKKILAQHYKCHDSKYECDICGKNYSEKIFLARHKRTHTGERPYTCGQCGQTFTEKKYCEQHRKSMHSNRKFNQEMPFKCEICGKGFHDKYYLKNHSKTHSDKTYYKCNICSQEFKWKNCYDAHMRTHSGENMFTCETCGKSYSVLQTYKNHVNTHTLEKQYKCDICNKIFYRHGNLTKHRSIHFDQKPYKCRICPKRFKQNSTMHTHEETHKPKHLRKIKEKKTFSCEICNRTFSAKCSLEDHMRIHSGETHKCDICNKEFSILRSFVLHKKTHTKEISDKCHLCGRGFICRGYLLKHLKTHAGLSKWKCDVCGLRYKHLQNLKRHQLVHTGEKPFSCNVCDKGFLYRCVMLEHMKIHDPSKPKKEKKFTCYICKRGFTDRTNMANHISAVHEGLKPYKCDTCNKCFANKSNLHMHMLRHSNYRPYECSQCGKKTASKYHLNKHIKIVHDKQWDFECTICHKFFSIKLNLKTHMEKHHGDKSKTSNDENQVIKRCKCHVCAKLFMTKSNVKRHLKNVHKIVLPKHSPYLQLSEEPKKTDTKVQDKFLTAGMDENKNSQDEVKQYKRLKHCNPVTKNRKGKSQGSFHDITVSRFGNLFENLTQELENNHENMTQELENNHENMTQEHRNLFENISKMTESKDSSIQSTYQKLNVETEVESESRNIFDNLLKIDQKESRTDKIFDKKNDIVKNERKTDNIFDKISEMTEDCTHGNIFDKMTKTMTLESSVNSQEEDQIVPVIIPGNVIKIDDKPLIDGFILVASDGNITVLEDTNMFLNDGNGGDHKEAELQVNHYYDENIQDYTREVTHGISADYTREVTHDKPVCEDYGKKGLLISDNIEEIDTKDNDDKNTFSDEVGLLEKIITKESSNLDQFKESDENKAINVSNKSDDWDKDGKVMKEKVGNDEKRIESKKNLEIDDGIGIEEKMVRYKENGIKENVVGDKTNDIKEHMVTGEENKMNHKEKNNDKENDIRTKLGNENIVKDEDNFVKIVVDVSRKNIFEKIEVDSKENAFQTKNHLQDKASDCLEGVNKSNKGIKNQDKARNCPEGVDKNDKATKNDDKVSSSDNKRSGNIFDMLSRMANNEGTICGLFDDTDNIYTKHASEIDNKEQNCTDKVKMDKIESSNGDKVDLDNNLDKDDSDCKDKDDKENKENYGIDKVVRDNVESDCKDNIDKADKENVAYDKVDMDNKEDEVKKDSKESSGKDKAYFDNKESDTKDEMDFDYKEDNLDKETDNTEKDLDKETENTNKDLDKETGNTSKDLDKETNNTMNTEKDFDKETFKIDMIETVSSIKEKHSDIDEIQIKNTSFEQRHKTEDCDKVDTADKESSFSDKNDKDTVVNEIMRNGKVDIVDQENVENTDDICFDNKSDVEEVNAIQEFHSFEEDECKINTNPDKIEQDRKTVIGHKTLTIIDDSKSKTCTNKDENRKKNAQKQNDQKDKNTLVRKMKSKKRGIVVERRDNATKNGSSIKKEIGDAANEKSEEINQLTKNSNINNKRKNAIINKKFYFNKRSIPSTCSTKEMIKTEEECISHDVNVKKSDENVSEQTYTAKHNGISVRDRINGSRKVRINGLKSHRRYGDSQETHFEEESVQKSTKKKSRMSNSLEDYNVLCINTEIKSEDKNVLTDETYDVEHHKSEFSESGTNGETERLGLQTNICTDDTSQNDNSNSHSKKQSGNESERARSPSFICHICYEEFTCKKKLRSHSYAHTQKYMFSCQICDKGFYWEDHLERHLSIH